jgi:ABC-2 type transport system ATP-binding protein
LEDALRLLVTAGVKTLTSQPPTLEELFLRHYEKEPVGTGAGLGAVSAPTKMPDSR